MDFTPAVLGTQSSSTWRYSSDDHIKSSLTYLLFGFVRLG